MPVGLGRERERFRGVHGLAEDIVDGHAQDAQELALIEMGAQVGRDPVGVGGGQAFPRERKPGVCVQHFVVFIGFVAGGDAAQKRHGGGYVFAAYPADEIHGFLRVSAVAADANAASAEERVGAGDDGIADVVGD